MLLTELDSRELFSLTMWKSERGFCVGVQRFAGDQVHYATRQVLSDAITAAVEAVNPAPAVVVPPCPIAAP